MKKLFAWIMGEEIVFFMDRDNIPVKGKIIEINGLSLPLSSHEIEILATGIRAGLANSNFKGVE